MKNLVSVSIVPNSFVPIGLVFGVAVISLGAAGPVSAIQMRAYVSTPYQVTTSSNVRLGHTVFASTDFNRLTAGGTYVAQCISPVMGPIDGQRTESADAFLGGLKLTVTIPKNQPAILVMPGFSSLQRGARVDCTYRWTARAVEGGYTIGSGGIGVPIGQGEATDGSTELFSMQVPSLGDSNENSPCLP